jgi:predicted site-specific integrase-resolvase
MFDNSASSFTLTEKELAKFLGISIDLVRHLRRTGRLPFVRINTRIVYLRSDAVAFLEQHRSAVAEVAA